MVDRKIAPVILSGGVGSRLWPLSRECHPKQLIALNGSRSLIQETALRIVAGDVFAAPIVLCAEDQRFLIAAQLREVGIADADIILEPVGRNTAPAAAVAALRVLEADGDAMVLLLPADHHIADAGRFRAAVDGAIAVAASGAVVMFGIRPTRPDTGYGYIRRGAPFDGRNDASHVDQFVEKPDEALASRFLADGTHLWNSGIVLCRADRLVDELAAHAPDILASAREALSQGYEDLDFYRLHAPSFEACPAISIDCAVMERTRLAAVVSADFPWSDIGSWSALWEASPHDGDGNATAGDVVVVETSNSYVRSDGLLTAVVGADNLVVVTTADAVLVAPRDRTQDVRRVVERLRSGGRPEARYHAQVYRPWGAYQTLQSGNRFLVKLITVNPGARLSLQRHYHRAEHWVVVSGTALVTRDDEEMFVRENESVYLPLGCAHRLSNPGKLPLLLIEVQSGPYLQEDDIVRLDDDFARVGDRA